MTSLLRPLILKRELMFITWTAYGTINTWFGFNLVCKATNYRKKKPKKTDLILVMVQMR